MRKLCVFVLVAAVGWAQPVLVQMGPKSLVLNFPSSVWPEWEGPLSPGGIPVRGIPLKPVFEALGGLNEDQTVFVFTQEGLQATLKKDALEGAILGFPWEEEFSQGPTLFGRDFAIPGVRWLFVDWKGETLPEVGKWPEEARLTLATPEGERTFTLSELEQRFVALTYPGSYVTSSGRVVSSVYTGFLLSDLLGNWPEDAELEVVAADGYRMRYRYGSLSDSEGTWILAFKQDGKYMPFNPGYFRMVKVGPGNPRFQSSASAKMVVRIEIRGQYSSYSLRLSGAVEKIFSRWDLESAVACPCHAQAVSSTHKGETHTYIGLPLWRLLAYVDDEVSPEGFGIKYDESSFNWEKAKAGYLVEIRGKDGFSQTIPSSFLAGNDLCILALKIDGRFLSEEEGGPLLFVWDDRAAVPENLKRVKWVTEIVIHFGK
jgi:DMSO/TMAO reductase YedYZ molybdopterin-dependent catalytic subunit